MDTLENQIKKKHTQEGDAGGKGMQTSGSDSRAGGQGQRLCGDVEGE